MGLPLPAKLAITSPAWSSGSVGIVRFRTKNHGASCLFVCFICSACQMRRYKCKYSQDGNDNCGFLIHVSPRSWDRPKKPPVVQPSKNFPIFYGARRFINVFTSFLQRPLSWARTIHFMPYHPKIDFNILHPPGAWASWWIDSCLFGSIIFLWPLLWSSGQSSWLQVQRSRVRLPAAIRFSK
jgi:hypothetical protein